MYEIKVNRSEERECAVLCRANKSYRLWIPQKRITAIEQLFPQAISHLNKWLTGSHLLTKRNILHLVGVLHSTSGV